MKIFLAGTSFDPAYGGPAFSVSRLALALAETGASVGLWAPDGSAASSAIVADHPSLAPLEGPAQLALEQFGRPDILHDNGLWMPHNHRLATLAVKRRIPRIVSIRGMLEPWAINHKSWKKKLAWQLYQRRDLQRAQCLHVTSKAEARTVQKFELGNSIHFAPNGVDIPQGLPEKNQVVAQANDKAQRVALFLGRIYPVKGLPLLIEAWASVRPEGWVLHIVGPDEAGHRAQVEALVRKNGLGEMVRFLGPVVSTQKSAIYSTADLFVLPTHTENFGMVVGEALAHSVPVLTTKGAPWPMLEELDCGWWVDISVDGIADGLRRATSSNAQALKQMGMNGLALVEEQFSWKNVAAKMNSAYEKMMAVYPGK